MPYLPSLPADAALLEVFRAYPATARPLLDYHQVLMRGPSSLSVAERELIAAYVSGLNACGYCHGIHAVTAASFGIDESTLTALLADPETAPVEDKFRPLLRYARKLTENPGGITPPDVDAVFAAGWDERALHDAVSVAALFNLMNRLVEGLGIDAPAEYYTTSGRRLAEKAGYAGLHALLPDTTSEK